jgi:hypothetical protein
MSKPVDFLTASGEELVTWYYCHPSDSPESLADLRDQTAAAVEAKVRGECADTLRDMESASHGYRRSSEEWQRRAERAEADANEVREAFKRDEMLDAYRTAVRAALVAEMVAGVEKMRGYGFDEHEELIAWEGGWYVMRSDVTDYLHGLAPETDR